MASVMIVEDEDNQRLLYVRELGDEGYDVIEAAGGRDAIDIIRSGKKPDVVVLDISMPDMDGIETLGKILSQDNSIPVILNTAYSTYKDNFMTWSADAYVVKSGDLTELKTKIKDVLEQRAGG
ncbi:MAG: response regulator [Planctomycetes bacterium]|nr:response regulator [Planctomycetota bacterium]